MGNALVSLICFAVILIAVMTLSHTTLSSADLLSQSWKDMEAKTGEIARTDINCTSGTSYDYTYDFGTGAGTDNRAYRCGNLTNIALLVPGTETELTTGECANIAQNDSNYDEAGNTVDDKYHRFIFTIKEDESTISQIDVTWEAQDEENSIGNSYLYIWDSEAGTPLWVQIDSHASDGQKHTYSASLTTNLTKYVDSSGYLYVLGLSSDPTDSKYLRTYYVDVTITFTETISVANEGKVSISDWSEGDLILQYYDSGSTYYSKWLTYTSSVIPSNDEWTVVRIYIDQTGSTEEIFQPNILNSGEKMVIRVNPNPAIGTGTINRAIVSTPNGVTASAMFNG